MKYFLILLLSLMGLKGFATANNGSIDSLKKLISKTANPTKADTLTINRLNKLAALYFEFSPDSAFNYGQKSITLSRQINYRAGLAYGLLQTGHVSYFKGKSANAIRDLNEAINLFKKLNDYGGEISAYIAFGRMYNLLADYTVALKYLNLALKINTQLNNKAYETDIYKNIGNVYYSKGELSNALDFYYKALFLSLKNHYVITSGEVYNDIGTVLHSMEVYPNALEHLQKALKIFEGTNNMKALGTINENIGEVLLAQNQYDRAIEYLDKANAIVKKQNDKDGLSSVYTDLGLCYAHKNDFTKTINYIDTSLQIAVKYKIVYNQAYALIGLANVYNMQKRYADAYKSGLQGQQLSVKLGNLSVKANAALQLNIALAGLGRVAEAYNYLNQYIGLKNQLKNNESIEKSSYYNFELTFALKERQLEQQQREKDLIYQQNEHNQKLVNMIFIIVIIAMVLISMIYYREKRKQQDINIKLENKNSEVLQQKTDLDEQAKKLHELNTLKDRLISILAHDLRAPLSTLKGLFNLLQDDSITHQELIEMIPGVLKKLDYTSDFLDTLLFWINSQMENFTASVKEFSVTELIMHEASSYKEQAALKGVTLDTHIPEHLTAIADPNSIRIVVRNLITNAIKFTNRNDTIEVSAWQTGDKINVAIKDTGVGISADRLKKIFRSKVDSETGTNNESGTGMGLLFCRDLIEKCSGEISVKSELGHGTEFSFSIPLVC